MADQKKGRGGARPGAGRKPKPKAEPVLGEVAADTPLAFLEGVMRDTKADDALRVKAAIAAAQYRHPKVSDMGKKEAKQRASKEVAATRFQAGTPPRLVRDNTK